MGGKKGHKEGRRNSLRVPGGGQTPAERTELQPQRRGTNVVPPRPEGAGLARLWGSALARGSHLAPGRGRRGSPGPGEGSHLALEGQRDVLAEAAADQGVVELVQGDIPRGRRRREQPQGAHGGAEPAGWA